MANGHGGERTPVNPAPASGPGKLAKRTDGGPAQKLTVVSGQDYGDRQATLAQERSAGMAQSPAIPTAQVNPQGAPSAAVPGAYAGPAFDAPTARPGEPVTAGVPIGPGPGPEAMNFQPPQPAPTGQMTALLQKFAATDNTGTMAQLASIAQARGV